MKPRHTPNHRQPRGVKERECSFPFCIFLSLLSSVVEVIERERIVPVEKIVTRPVPVNVERTVECKVTVPRYITQNITRQVQVGGWPPFSLLVFLFAWKCNPKRRV